MFTRENTHFMRRCFDVSRLANAASPNPSVGSIIVAPDGRIIGEGYTQPFGGPHAEVMAVAAVNLADQKLLPLSTIYVTLEPCGHFGKTKPCVDLILREKIPKVVIAHLDPNPLVGGNSVTKLRANGVDVQIFNYNNVLIEPNTEGSMPKNIKQFENAKTITLVPFFTNMTKKRPFIILKWAESSDGFIGHANKQTSISNSFSKRLVHKWRSEVDAIMIGTTTAETDNPELTNRFYFGKSPVRVVLDRNERLMPTLKLFDDSVKTLIFSGTKQNKGKNTEGSLKFRHSTFKQDQRLPKHTTQQTERRFLDFDAFLLDNILNILHAENIGILFVEGGAQLLNSFIERGLWDEARVFTAAKTLGKGIRAPKLLAAQILQTIQIDDDTLRTYKRAAALEG